MNFKELGLIPAILKALEAQGYKTPTPIQSGAIPPALIGRDVLGIAQTGTGKTCAFATPILQRLAAQPQQGKRVIRSLILTPTRELALQIQECFEGYGKNLPLRSCVIFGGVGQQPQVEKLQRGVDILVATPGRLLDLQGQGLLDLSHVEIFVLDEADRMLDMGFIHDVRRVLKLLPEKKQTLFFSATMPPEVQSLVNALLHDPAKVTVTPVSSPVEVIDQSLYFVDKPNKSKLLAHLVSQPGVKNALVFSRTKHGANKIAGDLVKAGITAAAIHGNKSQTARQQALADFKAGRIKVLAATDIAARGIDIEELSHVFNYNLPDVPETYVHRIGRTGRAGHEGTAISFCDISEKDELKAIEKLLGRHIPVVEGHPWPMQNFEPPKRDKNGKIINPEDAEARQAARERKAQREHRRAGPDGAATGQKQASAEGVSGISPRTAKEPTKRPPNPSATTVGAASKPARSTPKPSPDRRTPGQKRQAAGYKPSKTLDDALSAVAPKSAKDEAFQRWMEEERRIQAQRGYISDPLAGEEIMDATARLLAPKREDRRAAGLGAGRTAKTGEGSKTLSGISPRAAKEPAKSAPNPNVTARKSKPSRTPPVQKPKAPKPTQSSVGAGSKPARPTQKPASVGRGSPDAPKKPAAQKPEPQPKRGLFGKKPVQDTALEERKARARQRARERRAAGELPRSGSGLMDSTEHASLMKPYYLNDDE